MKWAGIAWGGTVLAGMFLLLPLRAEDGSNAPDAHRAGAERLHDLEAKVAANDRAGALAAWRAHLASDPNLDGIDDLAAFQLAGLRLGAALLDAGDAAGAREVLAALWVRDRIAAVQPLRIAALRRIAKDDPQAEPVASSVADSLGALPSNPGYDAAVRLRLATALLLLGKAAEADAVAAKIGDEIDGKTVAARELLRAEAEGSQGNFPAALARLEKLGNNDRALFLTGYDLVLSGRNEEGAAKLATVPDDSPYREAALFWTGMARLNGLTAADFGAAREAWTRQLAAFPQGADHADAAFQLARLPLSEGKPEVAATALDAWLHDNPAAPSRLVATALAARAACARALGKGAEADVFLLQGAEKSDDFTALPPALAVDFADALRKAGRIDAARQADEAALRPAGNPETARARGGLALLALRAGTSDAAALDGARADLEKALAVPGLPPATAAEMLVGLGDAYAALGQPGKAVPCYQRVYVMYGAWLVPVAQAYWRSGQAFEKLGKKDEALATYRELAGRADLAAQLETALAKKRLAEWAAP